MANNDFKSFVENANANEAHSLEIQQTRVGGLGGSDAAMVLKIGRNGLAALTNTDLKRLAVMCGLAEQDAFGGNMYTNAGHKFEDWFEAEVVKDVQAELVENGETAEYAREFVLSSQLAKNFKTFAHADFAIGNSKCPKIVELKFVTTKTTDKVLKTYEAQLQWYYMLGAKSVHLAHGTGTVDNAEAGTEFNVTDCQMVAVECDEDMVKALLNGVNVIDKALGDGWLPVARDKAELDATPETVREAFAKLAEAKNMAATAKEDGTAAEAVLREYMDDLGFNGIVSGDGHSVSITSGKTTTTFDLKKFIKNITEKAKGEPTISLTLEQILDEVEAAKKTTVSAPSLTFK